MDAVVARTVRPAAVAGRFYPAEADALGRAVDRDLARAPVLPDPPRAVIAPHAGHRFSGRLAATAIGATRTARPRTVVILSPSHYHDFGGIALPAEEAFATPLGPVALDNAACDGLRAAGLARTVDAAHAAEHGIEVLLPFLRRVHPEARIVPLVIGRADASAVAAAVDHLARTLPGPALFVLSSDLSHFLRLDAAARRDAATAARIETGDAARLGSEDACGARAISGFLRSDTAAGLRPLRLAMANSHAVTADAARTVGYGAWAFLPPGARTMPDGARRTLLAIARQSLASRIARGRPPALDLPSFPAPFHTRMASFVTLEREGRLRGCIGSLAPRIALVEDVAANAQKAGLEDPRFRPVGAGELDGATVKVALLSPSRPMRFGSEAELLAELVPGRDGLILSEGGRRGTFLPMVWESLPQPRDFLAALKVKAGLDRTHWSDSLRIERFEAEAFSEEPRASV